VDAAGALEADHIIVGEDSSAAAAACGPHTDVAAVWRGVLSLYASKPPARPSHYCLIMRTGDGRIICTN